MRLVSKGNVICRGHKEVICQHSPLSEHGCGLPRVPGSQPWSLGLGDSRFGSTFSFLLSESNFSFSDLRQYQKENKGGLLWHREIQYFIFCAFTVNENCTSNAKVSALSVLREIAKKTSCREELGPRMVRPQQGWSVQGLILAPD